MGDNIGSRLFLSADLIGSTARKQEDGAEWLGFVLAFYQQFPHILAECIESTCAEAQSVREGLDLGTIPKLWKAVGDELLYSAEVGHELQLWVFVNAWITAMRETERTVLGKRGSQHGMTLKGGAWVGTFPDPDRKVAVPLNPGTYEHDHVNPELLNRELLGRLSNDAVEIPTVRVDYVGPGMDTGFRVLKNATRSQFPVSVEVAWALAAANKLLVGIEKPIYYSGEASFKGVWDGRGYPVFALDAGGHHPSKRLLDKFADRPDPEAAPNDQIEALAISLHSSEDWPCLIHLADSDNTGFQVHVDRLERADAKIEEQPDIATDETMFTLEEAEDGT